MIILDYTKIVFRKISHDMKTSSFVHFLKKESDFQTSCFSDHDGPQLTVDWSGPQWRTPVTRVRSKAVRIDSKGSFTVFYFHFCSIF